MESTRGHSLASFWLLSYLLAFLYLDWTHAFSQSMTFVLVRVCDSNIWKFGLLSFLSSGGKEGSKAKSGLCSRADHQSREWIKPVNFVLTLAAVNLKKPWGIRSLLADRIGPSCYSSVYRGLSQHRTLAERARATAGAPYEVMRETEVRSPIFVTSLHFHSGSLVPKGLESDWGKTKGWRDCYRYGSFPVVQVD